MSSRTLTVVLFGTVVPLTMMTPVPGSGQQVGSRFVAAFEAGGRAFTEDIPDRNRGWFELYRDVPDGPILRELFIQYLPGMAPQRFTFVAREVGQRDQAMWARARRAGRFDAQLRWDRIAHTYSTTARSFGNDLPAPRPDSAALSNAPRLDAVRGRWDPVRASVHLMTSGRWDTKAEYTFIDKSGERPMGMAFGSPGSNHREVLEPIDQTMHNIRLTESYASPLVQGSLTYALSAFNSGVVSIVADNPLVDTDTPTSGSASGRSAAAPGNIAHTLSLAAAFTLPARTRVTGTVTYSWRRQDTDFIPSTINSAITDPRLAALPVGLQGDARTTLVALTSRTRLGRDITLGSRFRYFGYRDNTPELLVPALVVNDRSLDTLGEERHAYPFTKENLGLDVAWRPGRSARLSASYTWEGWERARDVRAVRHTGEHIPRLTLDVTGLPWLHLRTSAAAGWRRIDGEYIPVHDDLLPELRRFDMANRNRWRVDALADIFATDALTLTGTFGWARDTFPNSAYGVQRRRSVVWTGEATWAPTEELFAAVSYTRESFRGKQRSRMREPGQLDNVTFDWVADNNDLITTWQADLTATVIPRRLEVGGMLQVTDARLETLTSNPVPPAGGTASQIANATAGDLPDITDRWTPVSIYARYYVASAWAVTARYTYDGWRGIDWRTDGLVPATGSDVFLGNDYRNYDGQYLMLTISYQPWLLRAGRSAL